MWNSSDLNDLIHSKFGNIPFVIVSNREPYIHIYREARIDAVRPASGLVSGLDPVMIASKGIWVAHGSGSADKTVTDAQGRIAVPPNNPQYTLKRVWLSKVEETGYYYGFANEGLWPLCHIAYVRPQFRESDWNHYKTVNEKFSRAILEEIDDRPAFIFVQDYHLALVPRYLKQARPDLLVAQFWHIPWPNREAFRVCPWGEEILEGLLANDLLCFHIQYHCNNFLDTVDRAIEAKVDYERFSVTKENKVTLVRPHPISIDFEKIGFDANSSETVTAIEAIKKTLSLRCDCIGIGVDRIDYTKGIPERLLAIDHFLEQNPEYKERFVFIQIGALSRVHIEAYKDLNDRINELVEQINWRHATTGWSPIIFSRQFTDYQHVLAFYRMANFCIVSSLHDGMNLVAKEFVASRNDETGVLLLSQFTGAARELSDALLFNPYHIEGLAQTIKHALSMPNEEKRLRMMKMRAIIAENNAYKWAAKIIQDLTKLS